MRIVASVEGGEGGNHRNQERGNGGNRPSEADRQTQGGV